MHLCFSLVVDQFEIDFLFLVSPVFVRVIRLNLGLTRQSCSQFQVVGWKKYEKKSCDDELKKFIKPQSN